MRSGDAGERKRKIAVSVLDMHALWRPISAYRFVVEAIQHLLQLGMVDLQTVIAPCSDDAVRFQYTLCLGIELGQVEPVQCLRDGDDIDGVIGQAAGLGRRHAIFDIGKRRCRSQLRAADVRPQHLFEARRPARRSPVRCLPRNPMPACAAVRCSPASRTAHPDRTAGTRRTVRQAARNGPSSSSLVRHYSFGFPSRSFLCSS